MREEMERLTEVARSADEPEDFGRIRRGWFLVLAVFAKNRLRRCRAGSDRSITVRDRGEAQEQKATYIIATVLRRRRLSADRLARSTNGDSEKLEIASRLQSEIGMSVA